MLVQYEESRVDGDMRSLQSCCLQSCSNCKCFTEYQFFGVSEAFQDELSTVIERTVDLVCTMVDELPVLDSSEDTASRLVAQSSPDRGDPF